jgi:hypothetical protein
MALLHFVKTLAQPGQVGERASMATPPSPLTMPLPVL